MFENKDSHAGGKTELLMYIKNENKVKEPLFINFADFSDERIAAQLLPYWFHHVTGSAGLTPLENAKKHYTHGLNVMPMDSGSCVNEGLQFCYPEDTPESVLFGVAQNGGLALLYAHDVVCFREPDGFECWARMN